MQAGSRVTALEQVDKKGDEEEKDGNQKAQCFWLDREGNGFQPQEMFFTDFAQFIQDEGAHYGMGYMQI